MDTHLEQFRALTRVFDPIYRTIQTVPGRPDPSYVPEAHEDFRKQLAASLRLNDNVKLLIAGQPGCGKTTLLRRVAEELRASGRVVAFIDLETQTAVQDLGTPEMHLAAAAELLREAAEAAVAISQSALDACWNWLRSIGRDSPAPEAKPIPLADSIGRLLIAARESSDLRRELRQMIKQASTEDPFRLLTMVLSDLAAQRPVVVLDGLDKLPPDQAREFFLNEKKKPMADAPCAAILTIPLSIVYEPTFNVLSERYNNADSAVLPAVRLYDYDGAKRTRSERGFDVLRRIVHARVAPIDADLIDPGAIDRAIEGSGGNIRELARLLQASIVKASVREGDRIERVDIEAAIVDQRESYRRAFQPRFLPLLKKVRDESQLDNTDDIGKLLLYGLWVVEYRNGITWYSLPASVEDLLRLLDRKKP